MSGCPEDLSPVGSGCLGGRRRHTLILVVQEVGDDAEAAADDLRLGQQQGAVLAQAAAGGEEQVGGLAALVGAVGAAAAPAAHQVLGVHEQGVVGRAAERGGDAQARLVAMRRRGEAGARRSGRGLGGGRGLRGLRR